VSGIVASAEPWVAEVWSPLVQQAAQMTKEEFEAAFPLPEVLESVSFDALDAWALDAIEAWLGLSEEALAALAQNGFVAAELGTHSSFPMAYHTIYEADLPVLVTADSLLHAFHTSFDTFLQSAEESVLYPLLGELLAASHAELAARVSSGALDGVPESVVRDCDVYLTVARSLHAGETVAAAQESSQAHVDSVLEKIAALKPDGLEMFGWVWDPERSPFDFSQFQTRGHYTETITLERYFRTFMWLGRLELRWVEFGDDGTASFVRPAFVASVLLSDVLEASGHMDTWQAMEDTLALMIGPRDSAGPPELSLVLDTLGSPTLAGLSTVDGTQIVQAIVDSGAGAQKIASEVVIRQPNSPTRLLPRVFLLMGQRFAADSEVLSNVVYDRVQPEPQDLPRMLPHVGDVLFSLGITFARTLLDADLANRPYRAALFLARKGLDLRSAEMWVDTLYDAWLRAIALSTEVPEGPGLPEAMRTRAWRYKLLNAAAASWAELRHDTLLYVKQSYSSGNACEYPDAYLEPALPLYEQMQQMVSLLHQVNTTLAALGGESDQLTARLARWDEILGILVEIAAAELAGEALLPEHVDFLRRAIEYEGDDCGTVIFDGWYMDLWWTDDAPEAHTSIIADVHTAPTDPEGTPKGWVWHVGTHDTQALVLVVEGCNGAEGRAYVGPIRAWHEVLTENYQRLDNEAWRKMLTSESPPSRPAWTQSFWP
jgi:hypothetical protein